MKRFNSTILALAFITMAMASFTSAATITADLAGNGHGILVSNNITVPCVGNVCTVSWTGPVASIVAVPATGSVFQGWTGCDTVSGTSNVVCEVSATTVPPVTATFVIQTQFSVTADMVGNGKGQLSTSTNATISCTGNVCTVTWNAPNTGTSIVASALPGYTFGSWTGCDTVSGAGNTVCSVSDTTVSPVSAWFVLTPSKIGVFRNGNWYKDVAGNGIYDPQYGVSIYGVSGDIPLVGDWTGTNTSKIGVFRNGFWYLDTNGDGAWGPTDVTYTYGMTGDIPVVGDWNGSGTSKIGVFRDGSWYLNYSGNGTWTGCGAPMNTSMDECLTYGMAGDVPVVGDWTASGTAKIGIFRNGAWYLDTDGSGFWDPSGDAVAFFGAAGDIPVVGDWVSNGHTQIGVFRPSTSTWYLDLPGTGVWVGCGAPGDIAMDACYTFGVSKDIPVTGAW